MKVSIFGHSYVRDLSRLGHDYLIISDTTIHLDYFSYPGYGFQEFLSNPSLFDNLLQSKPDIVLVILGGNDIKVHVDLSEVKSHCEQFYKLLREKLPNSFIIASQIEVRHLNTVNRHGTPASGLCKKLVVNFNKWLCRQSFKDKILLVNGENKLYDKSYFREDGVHLNIEGLKLLFNLIVSCISVTPFFAT